MKLTLIIAIALAFTLPACMESPVSEGRADLPPKDFAEYQRERDALQNSAQNSPDENEVVPYR